MFTCRVTGSVHCPWYPTWIAGPEVASTPPHGSQVVDVDSDVPFERDAVGGVGGLPCAHHPVQRVPGEAGGPVGYLLSVGVGAEAVIAAGTGLGGQVAVGGVGVAVAVPLGGQLVAGIVGAGDAVVVDQVAVVVVPVG